MAKYNDLHDNPNKYANGSAGQAMDSDDDDWAPNGYYDVAQPGDDDKGEIDSGNPYDQGSGEYASNAHVAQGFNDIYAEWSRPFADDPNPTELEYVRDKGIDDQLVPPKERE